MRCKLLVSISSFEISDFSCLLLLQQCLNGSFQLAVSAGGEIFLRVSDFDVGFESGVLQQATVQCADTGYNSSRLLEAKPSRGDGSLEAGGGYTLNVSPDSVYGFRIGYKFATHGILTLEELFADWRPGAITTIPKVHQD